MLNSLFIFPKNAIYCVLIKVLVSLFQKRTEFETASQEVWYFSYVFVMQGASIPYLTAILYALPITASNSVLGFLSFISR